MFLLYTDGMGLGSVIQTHPGSPGNRSVSYRFSYKPEFQVTGSAGTKYEPLKWVSVFHLSGSKENLFATSGQFLHGVWFKPLKPAKWVPLSLKVSIQGASGAPYTHTYRHPSAYRYPRWMDDIEVKP